MSKANDGGPAFPVSEWEEAYQPFFVGDQKYAHPARIVTLGGMSLRDYFAGLALASSDWESTLGWTKTDAVLMHAKSCYRMADAMLAARSKPCPST
jgi:hypothetical protein